MCKLFLIVPCSGLRNDHVKESFELQHELDGKMFPCHFIKIGELILMTRCAMHLLTDWEGQMANVLA